MWDKFNEYFSSKGINVSYNTLGATEELVYSYLRDFGEFVNSSPNKKSQDMKLECYSMLYNFAPRDKKTGFENFTEKDRKFRSAVSSGEVYRAQISTSLIVEKEKELTSYLPYRQELVYHVSLMDNSILYLSGGLDSELVANAMLEAGINFIPVIFKLKDAEGVTQNKYDFEFATTFCREHNLSPIIKTINIDSLWESAEFKELAIDMQVVSTQLLTHAYMIKEMDKELPGRLHVLGGEVRFRSNYILDDGRTANLVQLGKLTPTYNNQIYVDQVPLIGGSNSTSLRYSNAGTWTVVGSNSGTPTSGSWTNTPGSSYEYRVTDSTLSDGYGSFTRSPSSVPTAWAPINSSSITICTVSSSPTGGVLCIFEIEVRVVGQSTPIQASIITLGAYSEA